jgi:hypothetical protein
MGPHRLGSGVVGWLMILLLIRIRRVASDGISPYHALDKLTEFELPHFFIIGTAKSGTTSLHDLLTSHEEICPNDIKEKHFFDKNASFSQGLSYYRKQFRTNSADCKYLLDSTPAYMRIRSVPEMMKSFYSAEAIAKKKLIVILRDPVSRECSWYQHHVRGCVVHMNNYMHVHEPKPDGTWNTDDMCNDPIGYCAGLHCRERLANVKSRFTEHLLTFDEKCQLGGVKASESFYDEQLEGYLKVFKRNQIFIISFEDLITKTKDIMRRLVSFLGLNEKFSPNVALPESNVNRINASCGCEAFRHLRKVHDDRGTLPLTMAIVNSPSRHAMEPTFTPFRPTSKNCLR